MNTTSNKEYRKLVYYCYANSPGAKFHKMSSTGCAVLEIFCDKKMIRREIFSTLEEAIIEAEKLDYRYAPYSFCHANYKTTGEI